MKKQLIELEKIIEWFPDILAIHTRYVKKNRYKIDGKLKEKYIGPLAKKHKYSPKEEIENIYFKAILINAFYSTMMGANLVYQVANHLLKKQSFIDKIINKGNLKGLNKEEINNFFKPSKKISTKTREYKPYSFLTKYISIHSQMRSRNRKSSRFPIYDGYIDLILKNSDLGFLDIKKITGHNLETYTTLYDVTNKLLKRINQFHSWKISFSDLDHILWTIGKGIFKNPHPKAPNRIVKIKEIKKTSKKDFLRKIEEGLGLR